MTAGFAIEVPLDLRVFLVIFDLLHLKRKAEPQREVALGERQIARLCGAGIEVLVKPEERRRYH